MTQLHIVQWIASSQGMITALMGGAHEGMVTSCGERYVLPM